MTTFRPVSFWLHVSSPGAPSIVSDATACASKRPDFSVLTVSTAPLPGQSRTVAYRIVPALSRVKRMSCAVPVGKFVQDHSPHSCGGTFWFGGNVKRVLDTNKDQSRILPEGWQNVRRLIKHIPRGPSPRPRGLVDCLIRAIADRLNHEFWTDDSGMPRVCSTQSSFAGSVTASPLRPSAPPCSTRRITTSGKRSCRCDTLIKSRFILQVDAARFLSHFSLPVVIYAETDLLPSETIRPGDPHGR